MPQAVEKRNTYLQRIAVQLERRGRFGDADVADVAQRAPHGLIQQHPAAYDNSRYFPARKWRLARPKSKAIKAATAHKTKIPAPSLQWFGPSIATNSTAPNINSNAATPQPSQ